MNELLDRYMPMRKVTQKEFKQKYKPWISDVILHKIKEKNKIFKKYVNCKNVGEKPCIFVRYKSLKNEITLLTRNSKKTYYENYFSKHKKDLSKTWQGIKEIINIKNKNLDHPSCITHENKNISDPVVIANNFNDYYVYC